MVFNPNNVEEIETLKAGILAQGTIREIREGRVKDFIVNEEALKSWKGDISKPAMNLIMDINHKGVNYSITKLFSYQEENGKIKLGQNSSLIKYKETYQHFPIIGDKVNCLTDKSGFFKLVLN